MQGNLEKAIFLAVCYLFPAVCNGRYLDEGPYRYTPFDWEKNDCTYARCGPLDNCTGLRGWTGERFEEVEVCKCLGPNYIVGTTCAAPIPADILNPCLNETNNNCDPNFTICIPNPFPMGYSILEGEVMYAYYVCECKEGFESTQCWKSRIANASFLHPCDERTNCLPFWTGNWPGGLGNCYKDTCSCSILESCKSNRECCSGKCVEGKCAKGKLNDFCYKGSCTEGLQCDGGWDPASEERDYYALCK